MKLPVLLPFLLLIGSRAAAPEGQAAFDQGLQELAARNWDKALDLLETAVTADPDDVRYGSEYRRAAILRAQSLHGPEGKPEDFDRPIKFFQQIVTKNPTAANAFLNYGLAYVDKIPVVDALTRVSVANAALAQFSKSLELRPSWAGYYTRGTSYLFWPRFFGRVKLGVADLETAVKMQSTGPKKPYFSHAWIALGEGYWKMDRLDKARAAWNEGLKEFPDTPALRERLRLQGDDLKALIQSKFDFKKRVDTDLKNLWLYPDPATPR
jgi:tetratricopeptide (TPR) repeat protein